MMSPHMAKRSPKGKQSDFIRFRPYHAFTTPADRTREAGRGVLLRIILVIGLLVALTAGAGLFFFLRH